MREFKKDLLESFKEVLENIEEYFGTIENIELYEDKDFKYCLKFIYHGVDDTKAENIITIDTIKYL